MGQTINEEQTLWQLLVAEVQKAARSLPRPPRRPKFADRLIVAMFLWSVKYDRCLSWVCDRTHYGRLFRPRRLPSISPFTRRIKSDRCQLILQKVQAALASPDHPSPLKFVDGKPMLVSPVSKDPDAQRGHVSGGFAKGYKLHAVGTETGLILLWAVTGLNTGECPVARELLTRLPPQTPQTLVLGDGNYDDKEIGKVLAARDCGYVTPLKGQAEHPVTLRQMGPVRRELMQVTQSHPNLVQLVLRSRIKIENVFSQLCELSHLPAFVRRIDRVRRWTGAKIILHNAKIRLRVAAGTTPRAA